MSEVHHDCLSHLVSLLIPAFTENVIAIRTCYKKGGNSLCYPSLYDYKFVNPDLFLFRREDQPFNAGVDDDGITFFEFTTQHFDGEWVLHVFLQCAA